MVKSAQELKTQEFHTKKIIATNKRAYRAYALAERFEAGIQLSGSEAKSLSLAPIDLKGSFVSIVEGEAYLEQALIPVYQQASWTNHAEKRKRKLLLHKKELSRLAKGIEQKCMTIVPVSFYRIKGKYKIEIALAEGKKIYDKREAIKQRDSQIEAARMVKMKSYRRR
jgi:SsrA-binding protein